MVYDVWWYHTSLRGIPSLWFMMCVATTPRCEVPHVYMVDLEWGLYTSLRGTQFTSNSDAPAIMLPSVTSSRGADYTLKDLAPGVIVIDPLD